MRAARLALGLGGVPSGPIVHPNQPTVLLTPERISVNRSAPRGLSALLDQRLPEPPRSTRRVDNETDLSSSMSKT
jgi:hypothetical protein